VQFDPTKPTVKAPATKRLKLHYDKPLSTFAFNFNLRRYNEARLTELGGDLHSSTFRLNSSTYCGIRWVHYSPSVY